MSDDPTDGPAPPWWWGLPPLLAEVDCAGNRHRLRWADGRLELPDHGDPDRERALGALAGEHSGCLRCYDAWHRSTSDAAVLVVTGRGPMDVLCLPDLGVRGVGPPAPGVATLAPFGWAAHAPMPAVYRGTMPGRRPRVPEPADGPGGDLDLLLLLSLGAPWSDRLTATVIAALLDDVEPGAEPPAALRAALYGRALASLRRWLGRPELDIDLQIAPHAAAVSLNLDADPAQLVLPIRWLLDVWVRGAAVVLGRFCLAAVPDPDRHRLALVMTDPVGTRSTIDLRLPEPAR